MKNKIPQNLNNIIDSIIQLFTTQLQKIQLHSALIIGHYGTYQEVSPNDRENIFRKILFCCQIHPSNLVRNKNVGIIRQTTNGGGQKPNVQW